MGSIGASINSICASTRLLSVPVRVHVVDPSAYTPPYDHALCRALAAAGAEVELFTSHFAYGRVAPAEGYSRCELFYRTAPGPPGSRRRTALKLAEHVPDMLRYRRIAAGADVIHFQWLPVQQLDGHLLPARNSRPLLLTAHDVLPREPRPGQLRAQRRLYERFDAIVAHCADSARRLSEELGIDPARVHVIPHGVLRPWQGQAEQPLPLELREIEAPVVLFFGLLRTYKGLELLLEAWRGLLPEPPAGAELWIVGMPRMDLARLEAAVPAGVRIVPRFISDPEVLALMRRANLVVLPYREIAQSGVAFTALGAGAPLLLSDVGGFREIAASGAARLFPGGDAEALRAAIAELLGEPAKLAEMARHARDAAEGRYSWEQIATRTLELYRQLGER
jgi:glycosyltransferase involved in cell wall biosynthesis